MSAVGIDIGGTFTDVVVAGPDGVRTLKVSSTPDPADGFITALDRAGVVGEVRHGTTVATNAVIERRGARLGFCSTEGFRHILHLARQDRPAMYDQRAARALPLVDLDLCVAIPERTGPHGEIIRPLDAEETAARLRALRGRVEALVVVLLHSYANPTHEREVAAIAASELPGVAVSLSVDVLPEFREYERASTTALNAFVQPAMGSYLGRVSEGAGAASVSVMWSGGGVRGVAETVARPVNTLLSGPAAGVLGAIETARRAGFTDIVTLDMGGTSADVSLVSGARPDVRAGGALDGLPFSTPCLDIVSVGAGGGSIAWLDEGGALRVGPRSAGANPGPACYGRGGTRATVTDAAVCAGLVSGPLAGGELELDEQAAIEAVERLGDEAGLYVQEAASGILRVVETTMARAIRSVSVERGVDVRRFALVAFGGAGPTHAVDVARELGMSTVVVPPVPGNLAALGLLVAPRRADVSRTRPTSILQPTYIREALSALGEDAAEQLRSEGAQPAAVERSVDCRYVGQSHELRVPVGDDVTGVR
ncbi:MAG TPA: hydantoinase/oxoprolinase family protein, partial [Actinomycetota bacterium]|nr:hydantoinase/oxoprolinase family protein [Actinomycetota bacterium]